VNPFRCRLWHLHDRLDEYLDEDSCKQEIESFQKNGQLIPALGRTIKDDDSFDIELVCGARRLFVARHLNLPLFVEVRANLSDRAAAVAMDIENRHRVNISPYERGRSYASWLRSGLFESQKDIALALGVSSSQISRLLALGSLPMIIIDAFEKPQEIREHWGVQLLEMWRESSVKGPLGRKARSLAERKTAMSAETVYRELVLSTKGTQRIRAAAHDQVILDERGSPVFRVKFQRSHVALVIPMTALTPETLQNVCDRVAEVLHPISLPDADKMPCEEPGATLARTLRCSAHQEGNRFGENP
jgi:ParB family chromosome partitioning protein